MAKHDAQCGNQTRIARLDRLAMLAAACGGLAVLALVGRKP